MFVVTRSVIARHGTWQWRQLLRHKAAGPRGLAVGIPNDWTCIAREAAGLGTDARRCRRGDREVQNASLWAEDLSGRMDRGCINQDAAARNTSTEIGLSTRLPA
jgi:hypothetical protein